MKRNSLKVLVKMNLLVRLSKSMEMESKKNTAMPKKKRNSLKVFVKMNLLVRLSKSVSYIRPVLMVPALTALARLRQILQINIFLSRETEYDDEDDSEDEEDDAEDDEAAKEEDNAAESLAQEDDAVEQQEDQEEDDEAFSDEDPDDEDDEVTADIRKKTPRAFEEVKD